MESCVGIPGEKTRFVEFFVKTMAKILTRSSGVLDVVVQSLTPSLPGTPRCKANCIEFFDDLRFKSPSNRHGYHHHHHDQDHHQQQKHAKDNRIDG